MPVFPFFALFTDIEWYSIDIICLAALVSRSVFRAVFQLTFRDIFFLGFEAITLPCAIYLVAVTASSTPHRDMIKLHVLCCSIEYDQRVSVMKTVLVSVIWSTVILGRVSHDSRKQGYAMYVALVGTLTTDMLGIES